MSRILLTALVAVSVTGPARAQTADQPPDPGFSLEVRGGPTDIPPEQFRRDVLAALPADLLDPARNFTRADGYQRDGRYRVVLLFHRGAEEVATGNLCTAAQAQTLPAPPANLKDLHSTTHLVAAFCENDKPRATARDQTVGETGPQQASFRFLVADVAKQLFPSGFGVLPGVGTAAPVAAP